MFFFYLNQAEVLVCPKTLGGIYVYLINRMMIEWRLMQLSKVAIIDHQDNYSSANNMYLKPTIWVK